MVAEKRHLAENLLSALSIDSRIEFSTYWKDKQLSQAILGATLQSPDFNLLKDKLSEIAGAEVALSASLDEWEFSHYAAQEALLGNSNEAFLVCQIF